MSEPEDAAVGRLSGIVQQEARRVLSERQLEPDPALVAEGWELRFIADAHRVAEMTQLYRELGFEVRTESMAGLEDDDRLDPDCASCVAASILQFRAIYVRRESPVNRPAVLRAVGRSRHGRRRMQER